jgi:hypothetical protein
MKICPSCKEEKDTKLFNKSKRWKDGLYPYCKKCELQKSNARRTKVKIKVLEYLKCHPCIDCGNSNPVVLEFDHRVKKESRQHSITEMLNDRKSWDKVEQEIAKCDVRCANCHRIKTAKQNNCFKLR